MFISFLILSTAFLLRPLGFAVVIPPFLHFLPKAGGPCSAASCCFFYTRQMIRCLPHQI